MYKTVWAFVLKKNPFKITLSLEILKKGVFMWKKMSTIKNYVSNETRWRLG